MKKTPVILDTDIGGDIDDTWALAMMLNSPELDIKLVVSATGNTVSKARLVAKILEAAGRCDIPVGIGISSSGDVAPQETWAAEYRLDGYPGVVYEDGVGAMVDMIMKSEERVTVVAIAPLTNIGAALEKEPLITTKSRFVGMHGGIYKGYDGSDVPAAEWNVVADLAASRKVFGSDWDMTITPLDTCGVVVLREDLYRRVAECREGLMPLVMENYKVWIDKMGDGLFEKLFGGSGLDKAGFFASRSTVLFDTVAVYLAFCEDLLEVKELGVAVSDEGLTVVDENAKRIRCALSWKSLDAFLEFLADRLMK